MDILSSEIKRNIISYFITFAIYLPFFAWWISSQPILGASPSQIETKELTLDLTQFQKETPSPSSSPQESSENLIPEEAEIPEEPKEAEIPEEPKVIKIPEEPKERVKVEPKPKIVKKLQKKIKHAHSSTHNKSQLKESTTSNKSQHKQATKTRDKNKFINQLRARINANKTYPHIAEKRGMQGSVTISFTINSAGKLTNLQASGPRIFINSAKEAVKKSFPITTVGMPLPMSVNLTLNYHLK